MHRWRIALTLGSIAACSSNHGQSDQVDDSKDQATVARARKQIGELDSKLASHDPASASSTCDVIKPDLGSIKKVDPKLADALIGKCGRDLPLRSMTVAVERAEKNASDCSSIAVHDKMISTAGIDSDPEVTKLRSRAATACTVK